jgi:hypothetical protein
VGRPIPVLVWMTVPVAFLVAALGVTGLASLPFGLFEWHLSLSVAPFGAATAVGLVTSGNVRWRARWQRRWLRWPYLAAVLGAGVALDGVRVPTAGVLAVGLPVAVLVGALCVRERQLAANRSSAGC